MFCAPLRRALAFIRGVDLVSGIAFATPVLRSQLTYQATWSIRWRYIRPTSATHLFCFQRRVDYDIFRTTDRPLSFDRDLSAAEPRLIRDEVSRNTRLQPEAAQTPFQWLALTAPRTRKSFANGSWCSRFGSRRIRYGPRDWNREKPITKSHHPRLSDAPVTDTFRFRSLS